jgi:hypothetical protein
MKDQLETRISEWLTTQGYPLEMKVASALRKEDFFVNQSPYYTDPETNTSREIDIIATKGDEIGFLEVAFIIECKNSTERPWVLFTAERHEEGRNKFFTFAILSDLARKKLVDRLWAPLTLKDKVPLNWFDKPERTAYGVTAAFTSGEDSAYKAVIGALKASINWNGPNKDEYSRPLRFVFPVVVFGGRLFETYLDANGKMVTQEVEEGFVTNNRSINGSVCSSVHVVTEKRLPTFCKEASELTNQLLTLLKPELEDMLKELQQR